MSRQAAHAGRRMAVTSNGRRVTMAFKDILVHLDNSPRSAVRLGIAAGLARRSAAQLTAVYVVDIPSAEFFYGAAMPLAAGGAERVVDQIRAEAIAAAE